MLCEAGICVYCETGILFRCEAGILCLLRAGILFCCEAGTIFLVSLFALNANGVRQLQPRVGLNPGINRPNRIKP